MSRPFEPPEFWDRWHLTRVLFPRRCIAGGWVWGLVWRRRTDEKWLYRQARMLQLGLIAALSVDGA